MEEHHQVERIIRLEERALHILERLAQMEREIALRVTMSRFRPLELLVYGFLGGAGTVLIGIAVHRVFGAG